MRSVSPTPRPHTGRGCPLLLGAACLLTSLTLLARPGAGQSEPPLVGFKVTDLGLINAFSYGYGLDVNSASQRVVGQAGMASGPPHAFLWDPTNGMQDLGSFQGASEARGIADSNGTPVVVGFSSNAGYDRAFRWTQAGGLEDLGTLGGIISKAYAVDDDGDIVGESSKSGSFPTRAFVRKHGETALTELPTLAGGGYSSAYALSGDFAAGTSGSSNGTQAARWNLFDNSVTGLGKLGGNYSSGYAVNERGDVAGFSDTAAGQPHAFLYTTAGGMQDLGILAGGTYSRGYGINTLDHVVGAADVTGGAVHGFFYADGQMKDLNGMLVESPGWTVGSLWAVDNGDLIVGQANFTDNKTHAVLLTPVRAQGPQINGFDPKKGAQGQRLTVTLFGHRFVTGDVADFGPGITVEQVTVGAAQPRGGVGVQLEHLLFCKIAIAGDAPVGPHTVKVTGPDGGVTVAADTFEVTAPAPAPTLSGFTLTPSRVRGGKKVNGRLTLSAAAPAGGVRVTFSSSNPSLRPPNPVSLASGKSVATFSYQTKAVNRNTTYRITAKLGASQKTVSLTLTRR